MSTKNFPCKQCGAKLIYAPGQHALKCPYCGGENEIDIDENELQEASAEQDYQQSINEGLGQEPLIPAQAVKCTSCGAQSELPANITSDKCPFCSTPVIASKALETRQIHPKALLPFELKEGRARQVFKEWIDGLWFAPSALKQAYRAERGLKGIYIPYFTYDSNTYTSYTGERGENYYETETYYANGERQTREVMRTAWYPASGSVHIHFDDLVVNSSKTLPEKFAHSLEPWRFDKIVPYNDSFVAGFQVEAYQTGLEPCFHTAQNMMEGEIVNEIHRDIGGDQQRVWSKNTQYSNITYKHVLLPIWLSTYQYGGKTYRFLVNGQTGKVQGERPYSTWKIIFTAMAVLAVLMIIFSFLKKH